MTKTFRSRWKVAMRKAAASIFIAGLSMYAPGYAASAWGQETASLNDDDTYYTATTNFNRANLQDPVASAQPQQTTNLDTQSTYFTEGFNPNVDFSDWDQQNNPGVAIAPMQRTETGQGFPSTVIPGYDQAVIRNTRDVGSLLRETPEATGISYFKRASTTNLFIRGYNSNQIQTQFNGQMWYAARPDQDTIVNKVDSGLVSSVVVIPGPYSALYGPGAAFVDIASKPTIRSGGPGFISQYRTVLNYDTNGQGYYARQVMDLGGADYGLRANVGFRHSDDYKAGDGSRYNASYTYRDIDLVLSKDFADGSSMDFQYLRNDITDAEFYGQPFNMESGVTNAFLGRYQTESSGLADHMLLEGWYNQTQIGQGEDTQVNFPTDNLVFRPKQTTYGNSYGARSIATYGDSNSDNTKIGVDFRGQKNRIQEFDTGTVGDPVTANFAATRALPNSEWINPGLLYQHEVKDDEFTIRYGGRYDFVQANPGAYPPPTGLDTSPELIGLAPNQSPTNQDFDLLSGFVTLDYALNDVWTATTSLGHGQRASSNFELFADRLFVAGYQHGFTLFIGNPNLKEERVTQGDIQLSGDFEDAHFMVRGYYAYVDNFVTVNWQPRILAGTTLVNGYGFTNSDSTFSGVEFNTDYDVTERVSVFLNGSYTHGVDVGQFGGPVFGVYPFQSRTGVRFEEGNLDGGYGLEFSARLVAAQDRIADGNRGFLAPFEEEQRTAGFQTMDIRGFVRPTRGLMLTGGVNNLADQSYQEHFDYHSGTTTPQNPNGFVLQPGRNYYMGMEWIY